MPVPFDECVAVLAGCVTSRPAIVERIESRLLNVKDKDASRRRDRPYFDSTLEACFCGASPTSRRAAALLGELTAAHHADGFEPMFRDTRVHQLDPADLIVRAYEHWEQHRWPGTSGRLAYAQTIFTVTLLNHLQALALRIWDEPDDGAPDRLAAIQRVLDALNATSDAIVRDAHWLVQTAQGPLTRGLAPYFRVAERIGRTFAGAEGIAIHAAGAKLAGGHLRSQLRYRAGELNRPPDSPEILATTRNSNAMDVALLVWDLVPLLAAYEIACAAPDTGTRAALADAILQGCSADPELLLERLDLLAPYTMVETVFVHRDAAGGAVLSPMGDTHTRTLARYAELLDATATSLAEDARALDPARVVWSPLGIVYGFVGDFLTNMALDTLHGHPARGLALDDMFTSTDDDVDRQARAAGWRRLPRRAGESEHFDYAPEWARAMFDRTIGALERRAASPGAANASSTPAAHLIVAAMADAGDARAAQDYCITSDVKLALATGATAFPRGQFVADRNEGRFLASAESDGRWFGISKVVLTERIAQGRDALVTGVPQDVVDILRLTAHGLWRV